MIPLLIRVVIAAVIALIFYWVCTALVAFNHSTLIFGLVAIVIFLVIAFSNYTPRTRGGGPTLP